MCDGVAVVLRAAETKGVDPRQLDAGVKLDPVTKDDVEQALSCELLCPAAAC